MKAILRKKGFKQAVAALLVSLLVITNVASAFAALGPDGFYETGERYDGVLTTELIMPNGVPAPNVTFGQSVVARGAQADDGTIDESGAAKALCKSLSGYFSDVNFNGQIATKNTLTSSQNFYTTIGADIADGTLAFDHAGVYYYTVTQTESGDDDNVVTASLASYTLKLHIVNDESTDSKLALSFITVNKDKEDDGTAVNYKVDPEPSDDPTDLGNSEFRFVNKFYDDTNVKVVVKTEGETANRNKSFDVNVTVTLPATLSGTGNVTLNYIDTAGTAKTLVINTDETLVGSTGKIGYTHEKFITMTDIPVGTTYKVVQDGYTAYTPSATVTGLGTNGTAPGGTAGTEYTVTISSNPQLLLLSESESVKNVTTIVNRTTTPTPTGLLTTYGPIAVLGSMVVVMLGFVVFSNRLNKENLNKEKK